jgi:hypothetical protein
MPMEAVVEAATLAHIHDDIVRMPLGYDTLLASGGAFPVQRTASAVGTRPRPGREETIDARPGTKATNAL